MQDIEGACGAIEEHDIQSQLNRFVIKIEESLYLYDVDEGKKFLLEEIQQLKDSLFCSGMINSDLRSCAWTR